MKPALCRQFFGKYSNIRFHENPSSGSLVFPMRTDGQTDRHDEANKSPYSKLRERA